jgi:hypothetical protein
MKALIKFMSEKNNFAYVCSATNADDKQKRIAELKRRFEQSNFSAVASFSADIADAGNPSGVYDSDDFATFNQKAKEYTAFNNLRIITAKHNVRDSIREYILKSNAVRKANKAKKQAEKAKENNSVSKPNWF